MYISIYDVLYIYNYIYIIIINYSNIRITQRNTILIISTKAKLAHSPLFCLSLRLPNSMQVEESDTHLLEILVLWAYGLWAFAASPRYYKDDWQTKWRAAPELPCKECRTQVAMVV